MMYMCSNVSTGVTTDVDARTWKCFIKHWSFVRGIHMPQVHSDHAGYVIGALIFASDGSNPWVGISKTLLADFSVTEILM